MTNYKMYIHQKLCTDQKQTGFNYRKKNDNKEKSIKHNLISTNMQYYPKNLVIVYLRIFSVNYTVNYSYSSAPPAARVELSLGELVAGTGRRSEGSSSSGISAPHDSLLSASEEVSPLSSSTDFSAPSSLQRSFGNLSL